MLRYALTQEGELISVYEKTISPPYFCPDCLSQVGKKMGPERMWHFFHYENRPSHHSCHKHDSALHNKIQQDLHKKLSPHFEVFLEYPIWKARRVADLAIPKEKIALEVQRSPLSVEAFLERTEAFEVHGWHVIWFFSSSLFPVSNVPRRVQKLGIVPFYILHEEKEGFSIWDELILPDRRCVRRELFECIPQLRERGKEHVWAPRRSVSWHVHLKGDFLDTPPCLAFFPKKRTIWERLSKYASLLHYRVLSLSKQSHSSS